MRKVFALVAFAFTVSLFAAPSPALAQPPMDLPNADKGKPEGKVPIYALARQAGLTTLADAVEAAGLQRTLQVEGPYTVFAPTNDAFAALGQETLDAVLADVDLLTDILLYHVAPGKLLASDVLAMNSIPMANGDVVEIDAANLTVNGSGIEATDVLARNGVVHVIDGVLLPPTDEASASLSKSTSQQSWGAVKGQFQD